MRTFPLALTLVALLPSAASVAATWSDPVGDEATFLASAVGSRACRHGAADITSVQIEVQSAKLTLELAVLNASRTWDCPGGASVPAQAGTQRVAFENCGAGCSPSLVLYRTWSTSADGVTTSEQCFTVDSSIPMGCKRGTVAGNVTIWSVPLRSSVHDLRGACFATSLAESRVSPLATAAAPLLETRDESILGPICL